MGKKRSIIIPPSKTSKKETSQSCNNSLDVKVLRPKVYITDSSSFKSLVQELTGNNIETMVQSQLNQVEIITRSSSASSSASPSLDSSKDDSTQLVQLDHHHHHNHLQMCFEDTTSYDQMLSEFSPPPEVGALDWQSLDVETLLLDADLEENPFFSGYYQYHQEEVSLCDYDYEFSGIV